MTIGTMDQLLWGFANPNRQRIPFAMTGSGSVTTSGLYSYWRLSGANKTVGVRPTVATVCDINTVGGFPYSNPDSVGQGLYLGRVSLMATTILEATIADRLIHHGNVSLTSTSSQTLNLNLFTAPDATNNLKNRIGKPDYSEVQWRFEIWNGSTATAGAVTFSYTNHLGVSGLTATATLPTVSSYQSYQIVPQPGDFIRSIESVNCSAVASGAANIATVVAYNERFSLALPAINNMIVADWETTGLVRIQDNSCLCITTNVGGTTPGTISGMITLIQG